jgi:hypothetical protein
VSNIIKHSGIIKPPPEIEKMAYAWASKEIFGFIWFMIKQNLQKNKAIDFEEKIFERFTKIKDDLLGAISITDVSAPELEFGQHESGKVAFFKINLDGWSPSELEYSGTVIKDLLKKELEQHLDKIKKRDDIINFIKSRKDFDIRFKNNKVFEPSKISDATIKIIKDELIGNYYKDLSDYDINYNLHSILKATNTIFINSNTISRIFNIKDNLISVGRLRSIIKHIDGKKLKVDQDFITIVMGNTHLRINMDGNPNPRAAGSYSGNKIELYPINLDAKKNIISNIDYMIGQHNLSLDKNDPYINNGMKSIASWIKDALERLKKTLRHELVHFSQDLLSKLSENITAGLPSSSIVDTSKPQLYNDIDILKDYNAYINAHMMSPIEFYARISDEIMIFEQRIRGIKITPESEEFHTLRKNYVYSSEFFNTLKENNTKLYHKAVSEFWSSTNDSLKRRNNEK